ncbi:hypothetical protein Cs7R123_49400 [Catellatospora sp. TT07R-123]|uniref:trypco2 family protein n=1 Tax=Catellatospora sp. TT07R-123 TaxID=2733863 RepID=UPI001B00E4FA|nr:trypco2 family protein [Catellatospora sp. TT07R-123]GHJ47598.1 hypothetical protein Cs7R123_49400 [Catellatospora sp. TT07R-123]
MDSDLALVDEYGVPLSVAIAQLREELQEAAIGGANERIRFSVESIHLNLEVVASATKGADGKVGLWKVLAVGSKHQVVDAPVHRVTLVLKPHDITLGGDGDTLIGDDY